MPRKPYGAPRGRQALSAIAENSQRASSASRIKPETKMLEDLGKIEVADLSNGIDIDVSQIIPPTTPSSNKLLVPTTKPHQPSPLTDELSVPAMARTPLKRPASDDLSSSQVAPKSQRRSFVIPGFESDSDDSDDDTAISAGFEPIDHTLADVFTDPLAESMFRCHENLQLRKAPPPPEHIFKNLLEEIQLDDDAPTGCRSLRRRGHLVKKKDYDDLGGNLSDDEDEGKNIDNTFGDGDEDMDLENEIEQDRKKVEDAAVRMGLKQSTVLIHRKEEIAADERGEAALPGDTLKQSPKSPLRNPREPDKDAEDDMEWIQGYQLGATDMNRKFKDVLETKIMWRVPDMRTALMNHQVLGVDWMLNREIQPKVPKGGLLADAMGIGKTIQSIAIMCLNPPPPPPDDGYNYRRGEYPQTTLIVAPVALLDQWKDEIETHCRRRTFKVHIYHGKGKDTIKTAKDLEQMDVVLCTYQAIMRSYPPKPKNRRSMTQDQYDQWFSEAWDRRGIFHRVRFWRVILDESHIIKNRLGQISMACQELDAENTWALSGTPFVNRLADVLPILKFIHHPTAGTYEQFKALGCESNNHRGAQRVQAILRKYMMRRTKRDYLMGKPIISLPKKRIRMVELKLNDEERALYEAVRMHAVTKINKYVEEGTEMKHFSAILTMLLRLRQVCDHPYLILQSISDDFTADDLDRALERPLNMREFVHEHSGPQKCTTKDEEDKKPSQLWRNDHEKDKKPSQLRRIMQACKRQKPVGVITHCPRCQGPIEDPVIVKKCRHVFCRECLTTAMAEDSHCPYNNGACGQHLYEGDFTSFNDTTKKEEFDIDDDSTWLDRADLMKDFHHSTKTDALRNQLKEWRRNHPNDKIVLFSQFTMMLDIVEKVIDDEDWVYTRYQGGMSMSARQQALSDFRNQAEYKIMLTSIKAGGVGLNLTHANLVISLDLWWNAAVELQAFDRVHRLGQKKEVFITRFMVKDSVEEKMLKLQQKKLGLAKAALGEGQLALGKLTRDELLGLFGDIHEHNGRMMLH